MDLINVLTDSLQDIAWKMAAAMVIAACLGVAWKLIEKKLLAFAEQKSYERKQKRLEEISSSPKIKIEHSEPTYEEWKAAKLAAQKKNHPDE